MTPETQSALTTLGTSIVGAVVVLGVPWIAYKTKKLSARQDQLAEDVKKVEVNTNSMREQMVNSAHDAGHRAGVADQKADAGNGIAKEVLVAVAEIKGHAAGVAEQKAADAKPKP